MLYCTILEFTVKESELLHDSSMAALSQTRVYSFPSRGTGLLAFTFLLKGNGKMACFLLLEMSLTLSHSIQYLFSRVWLEKNKSGFDFFIGCGIFSKGFHHTQPFCLNFWAVWTFVFFWRLPLDFSWNKVFLFHWVFHWSFNYSD